MNIDKIREALELAEAMADVFDQLSQKLGDLRERRSDRSRLDEIREALAELDKSAEPVAWMSEESGSIVKSDERIKMSDSWKGVYVIPLYTHPPQAAGLTVDELANIIRRVDGSNTLGAGALAEAITAAIKAKNT